MSFWNKKEAKRLSKILLFYNDLIKKPKLKGLKNIVLLHELPFYDDLNIYKMSKTFEWYVRVIKLK